MIYKLKKGDEVEIVAPSSYIENQFEYLQGIQIIRDWGLSVNQKNIQNRRFGYFAGDDNTRLSEVRNSQNSKLIIFAKGGWGSARLLERDIAWAETWMLGFSDTCSLLLSKYSKGSKGSIHGPMISTLVHEPKWSIERLKTLLFKGYVDDIKGNPLKNGLGVGEVIVSNLTIFSFLIGTNHLPNLKGKILIFEDINESIYKIDRIFTFLKLTKELNSIAGIGFGNFFDENDKEDKNNALRNLILERFNNYNIPIVSDLPIGHITGNACIPLGFRSVLDGNNGTLSINLN
tara:strand:- start:1687 stop:2553 length:867 start_codon:yes stop_codon:yes gene_type:complete